LLKLPFCVRPVSDERELLVCDAVASLVVAGCKNFTGGWSEGVGLGGPVFECQLLKNKQYELEKLSRLKIYWGEQP
jgi:hypothetical protein